MSLKPPTFLTLVIQIFFHLHILLLIVPYIPLLFIPMYTFMVSINILASLSPSLFTLTSPLIPLMLILTFVIVLVLVFFVYFS